MKKVEVKVNVINEMKKLRNTAYGDRLAWVEELIQNTQRAKATKVDIKVDYDKVVFIDNGIGTTEPQNLFEKSTSGWDSSIDSQNPFGEGFFSTLMVADKIRVKSVGFIADFDVKKMFEQNSIDCIEVKGSSRKSGFIVELTELRKDYSEYEVKDRVKEVAQYISGIRFFLNGKEIEHKDFTDTEGHRFSRVVSNKFFKGWLRPFKWGSRPNGDGYGADEVKTYAQERFVKDIYYSGVDGRILLNENTVDLRSPDRKEIIRNDKFIEMKKLLDEEIKETMLDVLRLGSDKDIDKYAEKIDRYVPVEEYEEYIKFVYTEDYEKLQDILAKLKELHDKGETDVDFDKVAEMLAEQEDEEDEELIEEMELRDEPTVDIGYEELQDLEDVEVEETHERKGGEIKENKVTFYVKMTDVDVYKEKVELAEYYKVPVILIRNTLEQKVLENKEGFLHIKELRENVQLSAQLKKVGAIDDVEIRAMWILGVISKGLGFEKNIFKIGDMTTYKETKVGDNEIVKEVEPALAVARGREIFIDRGCLRKENLKVNKSKRITNADRTFIVNNLETIAHELAHVMYGTEDNTKKHAEAQIEISNKILKGLF